MTGQGTEGKLSRAPELVVTCKGSAPEISRLMVRLAGQELLVMATAGPFIPGPVYTSKWLLDRGSCGHTNHSVKPIVFNRHNMSVQGQVEVKMQQKVNKSNRMNLSINDNVQESSKKKLE